MDPGLDNLRKFAEAIDVPILQAFIAAGYLTPEEAGQTPTAEPDAATVPTLDLIEEIRTRIAGHLDALDPPPAGRNPHPPLRPDEVADVAFYNRPLDQTDEGPGTGRARGRT